MNSTTGPDNATPSRDRCVTSYPNRRRYRPGVVYPPAVPGVEDMIDLHCHAHDGQQNALALAQLASQSGMRGIVYKTLASISGEYRPARDAAVLTAELDRWAATAGCEPISCYAGYGITMDNQPPTMERLRVNLADGVAAVWLPVFNHANSLHLVGGFVRWWDKTAAAGEHSAPLPWDLAVKRGYYMIDASGELKPEYAEYIRAIADAGIMLFTGHATHRELWAIVDLCNSIGFRKVVVDHPFSPFIDLTVAEMQELRGRGVTFNFTYDELSPLIGIDPAKMCAAIVLSGSSTARFPATQASRFFRTPSSVCGSSRVTWRRSASVRRGCARCAPITQSVCSRARDRRQGSP